MIPVPVDGGQLELQLRRVHAAEGRHAVVMLHGANSSSETFRIPDGGLARYLGDRGYDVWTLDWRGSPLVVDPLVDPTSPRPPLGGSVLEECRTYFTVDHVAEVDIPAALQAVRDRIGDAPLSVVAHCVGAGATSMAIARGHLEPFRVASVVLSTLGLFYEVPWNGWLKADDFLIERVLHEAPGCRAISPHRADWPAALAETYARWPGAWLPAGSSPADEMLRRLAFMFGQPYTDRQLDRRVDLGTVQKIFGSMHMGLYWHVGQMVRRGYAARFDRPEVSGVRRQPLPSGGEGDLVPRYFADKRITLIAGGDNQLWHRDAIDLMYEWLLRARPRAARCEKYVFPTCNIQELFWGRRSTEVFEAITRSL